MARGGRGIKEYGALRTERVTQAVKRKDIGGKYRSQLPPPPSITCNLPSWKAARVPYTGRGGDIIGEGMDVEVIGKGSRVGEQRCVGRDGNVGERSEYGIVGEGWIHI